MDAPLTQDEQPGDGSQGSPGQEEHQRRPARPERGDRPSSSLTHVTSTGMAAH